MGHFFQAAFNAAGVGFLVAVLSIALEPYVRRRWPQSLITWTRLLSGAVRDPLVAGHILVGAAIGIGYALLFALQGVVRATQGVFSGGNTAVLLGFAGASGVAFCQVLPAITFALGLFFIFFLLRVLTRRDWMAAVLFVGLLIPILSLGDTHPAIAAVFAAFQFATALLVLLRFGGSAHGAGHFRK